MPKHSTPDQRDGSMNLFSNVWLPTEEHISNIKQQQIYGTLAKHWMSDQSDGIISNNNDEQWTLISSMFDYQNRNEYKLSKKQIFFALANSLEVWDFVNILGSLSRKKTEV